MDFTFTDEQEAVRDLARQIFEGRATVARVKAIEQGDDGYDRDLWLELAKSNLLGIAVPEAFGGAGLGLVELCLLLEQQGRFVAPVPLWPALVLGALAVGEFGTSEQRDEWLPQIVNGDAVFTAALNQLGPGVTAVLDDALGAWQLSGERVTVPAAPFADRILVPASVPDGGTVVAVVDRAADGVSVTPVVTTNRERAGHVALSDVVVRDADVLGDAATGGAIVEWIRMRALVGLCALQVGVAEQALRLAADYSSARKQFGKPLSTFQGTALKAADAYIDTEAMRVTLWQAAWRLSEGLDATHEVLVAKFWASEGGHRVVHVAQHLHGGLGADIDYPVHRYFLWGKQIEDTLGGASAQLATLGRLIAKGKR